VGEVDEAAAVGGGSVGRSARPRSRAGEKGGKVDGHATACVSGVAEMNLANCKVARCLAGPPTHCCSFTADLAAMAFVS